MNKDIKNLGQVYTPEPIVNKMLELASVDFDKVSTILEPSAGEGHILEVLLKELGEENFYKKVTACEIDNKNIKILQSKFPKLNIIKGNTILSNIGKFDFIIGNPPYVRIHNIDNETKKELSQYKLCNGMYDLYQAFYEFGINHLVENGILVYIAPNSWLTNAGDSTMREYFSKNRIIEVLHDFKGEMVFEGFSTYTAITVIQKGYIHKKKYPWEEVHKTIGTFNDVRNGISTNCDRVYINDTLDSSEPIVKKIFKASTGKYSLCIYPYDEDGNVISITEIENNSPKAFTRLQENRELLAKRNMDKNLNWWEYARTQGIKNMRKTEKYAISNIYKDELRIEKVGKDVIVYSGLYMKYSGLVVDEKLMKYLDKKSGYKNGGWRTFNSSILKNY